MSRLLSLALVGALSLVACVTPYTPDPLDLDGNGVIEDWELEEGLDIPIDRETQKPLLWVWSDSDRSVGYDSSGPASANLSSASAVWTVSRRWYQEDAAAGLAWEADSGLTWDEKYAQWVDSLEKVEGDDGYMTVELTTPYGKTLPSPRLECAEMAMFLRVTFAAWHELPFFMSAYHPSLGRIHYGHFGIVDKQGSRVSGTPTYGLSYSDYSSRAGDADLLDNWPSDGSLRDRYLTSMKDDYNEFLGDDAYAGAYFDSIHLNKRVGYFMLKLLTNFGSMHMASASNAWNLAPEAVREGDVLVERWQRSGIGHVMVVKEVDDLGAGHLDAEIMFGSMPRIQPKWYTASMSKSYFTSQYSGGSAEDSDGTPYSQFGGGIKRWRTPVHKGGAWVNIVPVSDREVWVGSTDYDALGERVDTFKSLLGDMSPEEEKDVLLESIQMARDNLRKKPASCANRQRREEAFDSLYELMETQFGWSRKQTDQEYRALEDYVFAELEYSESKTCCWNSTSEAMYEIVMEYNTELIEDAEANGECVEPVVFKARDGGDYNPFKQYAHDTSRGGLWVEWSEDETCPQRDVSEDVEANTPWTDFCELQDELVEENEESQTGGCGGITYEGECQGNTVVWCDGGELHEYSCEGVDVCGWSDYYDYYWCL